METLVRVIIIIIIIIKSILRLLKSKLVTKRESKTDR